LICKGRASATVVANKIRKCQHLQRADGVQSEKNRLGVDRGDATKITPWVEGKFTRGKKAGETKRTIKITQGNSHYLSLARERGVRLIRRLVRETRRDPHQDGEAASKLQIAIGTSRTSTLFVTLQKTNLSAPPGKLLRH